MQMQKDGKKRQRGKAAGISKKAAGIGLHKNYFHVMASRQKPKYKYLTSLDDDIVKAYHKYETEVNDTVKEMTEIYYSLEEARLIHKFSKFLYKQKLFSNENSFAASARHVLFKNMPKLNHNAFIRYKKIIDAYNNEFCNLNQVKD